MLQGPVANATPMTFVGNLSGANEVPPIASQGTGLATIVLDPTAETIQINATFSGLTSNDTAAHIHCCADLGTNAGVATTLPAFPLFPLGVTSGNYVSAVFDLTQPLIYNPAFVTLEGGTIAQAEAALIAGIEGGQAYFNIHTMTKKPAVSGTGAGQLGPSRFGTSWVRPDPAAETACAFLLGRTLDPGGRYRAKRSGRWRPRLLSVERSEQSILALLGVGVQTPGNVEHSGKRSKVGGANRNLRRGVRMLRPIRNVTIAGVAVALMLSLAGPARAAVIWDEAINGPFGDFDHQTQLGPFAAGDNEIRGVTGQTSPGVFDRDYFSFSVPAGLGLTGLIVVDATSAGPRDRGRHGDHGGAGAYSARREFPSRLPAL